jgi:adenylylsulfate kinase-like enzyme
MFKGLLASSGWSTLEMQPVAEQIQEMCLTWQRHDGDEIRRRLLAAGRSPPSAQRLEEIKAAVLAQRRHQDEVTNPLGALDPPGLSEEQLGWQLWQSPL